MLCAGTASAAFPGKPGPIAYSKTSTDETGEGTLERLGGIFAARPQRPHRPLQLTLDPDDHSPSFSADGRGIVFVSEDGAGRLAIYYMPTNPLGPRRLVVSDADDPHFFPNGRAIVFTREVEGRSRIFTIRLDGSGLRQLTSGPHDDLQPAVSPNGNRIAFTSNRDRDGRSDRSDIFTMQADGDDVRAIIDGPRRESDPDWAPDGRRISFSAGNFHSSIFVIRTGAPRAKRLTHCRQIRCRSYLSPAFSPDGRHIAILGLGTRTSTVSVISASGRGFSTTIDSGGTEEEGFGSHVGAPTWSPADPGRRISASSVARVQSTPRSLRP
jgi:Tol biopolymer transport system component